MRFLHRVSGIAAGRARAESAGWTAGATGGRALERPGPFPQRVYYSSSAWACSVVGLVASSGSPYSRSRCSSSSGLPPLNSTASPSAAGPRSGTLPQWTRDQAPKTRLASIESFHSSSSDSACWSQQVLPSHWMRVSTVVASNGLEAKRACHPDPTREGNVVREFTLQDAQPGARCDQNPGGTAFRTLPSEKIARSRTTYPRSPGRGLPGAAGPGEGDVGARPAAGRHARAPRTQRCERRDHRLGIR